MSSISLHALIRREADDTGTLWTTRLHLLEYQIDGLVALNASLSKVGVHKQLSYLSLLGLRAALLQSVEHTHLHMQPIQWYL